MRPAAQAWEEEYASQMVSIGFARGKSNSAVVHRQSTDLDRMSQWYDFFTLELYNEAVQNRSDALGVSFRTVQVQRLYFF